MSKKAKLARVDAADLAGLTTLMNPIHLRKDIDLPGAERCVMGKGITSSCKPNDSASTYINELNKIAEELGIDLANQDEVASPTNVIKTSDLHTISSKNITSKIDTLNLETSSESDDKTDNTNESDENHTSDDESDDASDDDNDSETDDASDNETNDSEDDESDDIGNNTSNSNSTGNNVIDHKKGSGVDELDSIISRLEQSTKTKRTFREEPPKHKRERITDEQEKRRHINSVVGDVRKETRTTFGMERERIMDIKASKLEQIGQLKLTLEEEGIDCMGVTSPTNESSMEEIDSILGVLRLKNDRNRYSTMAEEVIMGLAEGIETVFDGSRTIPLLGWKPDYTGYHSVVNIKLHRMRFETSQVVGGIIERYNIGPTARIFMELLPSFFLYPRQQKKQRSIPGLDHHVPDAKSAMASIRASDERRTLDAI